MLCLSGCGKAKGSPGLPWLADKPDQDADYERTCHTDWPEYQAVCMFKDRNVSKAQSIAQIISDPSVV